MEKDHLESRLTPKARTRGNAGTSGAWLLVLILGFAFVARVLAALSHPMILLDETAYVRMAENLAEGLKPFDITGVGTTHFSPLFPLITAGVATILGDFVLSAYVVVIVFGTMLLVPAYMLAKDLAGGRAGLMTAALLAVMPIFVDYSSRLYSESVYIFFLLMALVFGRRMLLAEGRRAWGVVAGLSLGLAYLANPSAVFYFVALLVLAAGVALARRAWRPLAGRAVLFALMFLACAAPYGYFLHSELGRWTYSGKSPGNVHAAANNLRHGTIEWEEDLLGLTDDGLEVRILKLEDDADPLQTFLRQPVQGAKIFARQGYIFYSQELPQVFPLWLLPLAGLGLFAVAWDRRQAAGVGYLLLMMAPALFILTMYAHSRFFMPFVPLAAVWVAQGWIRLEEWGRGTLSLNFAEPRRGRLQQAAPWVVAVLVLLPVLAFATVTVLKQDYATGYRQAGERIRQGAGADQRIMSREFSSAFYAGGTAVMLPYAGYDETAAYARHKDVAFLVIGREAIGDWRPQLARLLEEDTRHPEWELIGTLNEGTSQETLIFRLRN